MRAVQTLLQGSGGSFSRIPEHYAQHLTHEYSDGSVSLLSKINTFEFSEDLEEWQVVETLEDLMKVDPADWPAFDDIATIDLDSVYNGLPEPALDYSELDFAEVSDMEYGNKVGRMFKSAIESVYGQNIDSVGDQGGKPPSRSGGYCKDGEGFRGTFEHDGKKFDFELCKDGAGDWHLAYSLQKASRDKLFKPSNDTKKKVRK